MMQAVLKQFCYPVNFLACACSKKCTCYDWSDRNRSLFEKSYLQKVLVP